VLDEVLDASLDQAGRDYFVQMLNTFGEASNIFVISHAESGAHDKFQNVIKFRKVGNFGVIDDGSEMPDPDDLPDLTESEAMQL